MRTIVRILTVALALATAASRGSCQETYPGQREPGPSEFSAVQDRPEFDFCDLGQQGKALLKPIQQIQVAIPVDEGRLPPDCSGQLFRQDGSRPMPRQISFRWQPTNLFHRPVYFDDVPLERHGQTVNPHLQSAISGAKFVLAFPLMPYKMGVNGPLECVTSLGHVPPGTCGPCLKQKLPWEMDAALIEAATAVTLALILP